MAMSPPALATMPVARVDKVHGVGGVYFVQQGENGPIKIGWSRNVKRRLAALQTATHERLRLLLVLDGEATDERRLHAWFAHERRVGEWFSPGGEVGAFVRAKLSERRPEQPANDGDGNCYGAKVDEPCWGEVKHYSEGDWFCEGHWEACRGHGYLPEPPRLHGPQETDEMGRGCRHRWNDDEPCWGKIVRYGDADDTYCEAHHPIDGPYAARYNEGYSDGLRALLGRG